jgi:hypothetical protein
MGPAGSSPYLQVPSLDPTRNGLNPVHTLTSYFLSTHLILSSSHLHIDSPDFLALVHTHCSRAGYRMHPTPFTLIAPLIFRESMNYACEDPHYVFFSSCYFLPLGFRTLSSDTINLGLFFTRWGTNFEFKIPLLCFVQVNALLGPSPFAKHNFISQSTVSAKETTQMCYVNCRIENNLRAISLVCKQIVRRSSQPRVCISP